MRPTRKLEPVEVAARRMLDRIRAEDIAGQGKLLRDLLEADRAAVREAARAQSRPGEIGCVDLFDYPLRADICGCTRRGMNNVKSIDFSVRGGKYQALAPYEIHAATATEAVRVPASDVNRATRAAIVQQLEDAGFRFSAGNYVSAKHAAQVRICVSGSGPDATIGVEVFSEPNAAQLLGE